MNYKSTRNKNIKISSAQAIAQGLSGDGGLFVPEYFPAVTEKDLREMESESYKERAERILPMFLSDFSSDEISDCVSKAYAPGKFSGGEPAPLHSFGGGVYFLELWHGPTCAFKDMALQILPHLLTKSLKKINTEKSALILTATSGDTGKAALEGFKDVEGTRILVFYPQNGVSSMQKRQMCTQEGANVAVCAVKGNFDDTQTGVKKIFNDAETVKILAESGFMFSSANSINWGRLLPQIVYYFSAYCDLTSGGKIKAGEPVNIAVPTGNFGDILAAYYARKMGLPVKKFICASNSNNVLTDFLKTGVYDRNRNFYTTISPSMDILVSSNLERLLFDLIGGNDKKISGWMEQLTQTGKYRADSEVMEKLSSLFYAGFCDDSVTKEEIKSIFKTSGYLCDPHTAVAANVYRQYLKDTGDTRTPAIIVSTASPYKFAADVLDAVADGGYSPADEFEAVRRLSELTKTPVPAPIAALETKTARFKEVCAKEEMNAEVLKFTKDKFI